MKIPELLCPAGSLDKLKVAMSYGADACYLGGQQFGLRAAAENFTNSELEQAVHFAHERGKQVFVVLNSFLHDKDLVAIVDFIKFLDTIKVDAVIVSDLGVVRTVRKHSSIAVHLSTQASCLNIEAGKLWKKSGVTRLILGREVSIAEASRIKKATGLEVELFIHGSMCMAYSGNCVISNFTQGRDSNRGGCAHSCRFEYSLNFNDSEQAKNAYFMSSKDLQGIRVLEDFIKYDIDSIKIEGRMKSQLYVGTMAKVYREALDHYEQFQNFLSDQMLEWESELSKVSHRSYTLASLIDKAGNDSIFNERETSDNDYAIAGYVVESVPDKHTLIDVRKSFGPDSTLELLPFDGETIRVNAEWIKGIDNSNIEKTNPSTLVKIPYIAQASELNILRARA